MAKRLNDETGPGGDERGWRAAIPGGGGRVRGRAAGPGPVRPAQADHLDGRGGGVAVRPAVGGAAPAGPALPDHVPGRHPGHDPARLPASGPRPGRLGGGAGAGRRQPGAAGLGPGRPGRGPLVYPLLVFDDFARRVVRPTGLDVVLGVVAILLVEATRRTVGWVLPAICLAFVAYAFFGGFLPFGWDLGHKGYDLERLVGQTYMGIEGSSGSPWTWPRPTSCCSPSTGRCWTSRGGPVLHRRQLRRLRDPVGGRPGRTATLAGFLLGTVSGSGVATTVTLGSVAWPVLRRALPANPGGGVLSAAGIGAILSPPTLGAAAFIIAEFLEISYLQVLLFATCPPCCTTWASSWPSRWTAAAGTSGSTSTPSRWAGCCCATPTSARWS